MKQSEIEKIIDNGGQVFCDQGEVVYAYTGKKYKRYYYIKNPFKTTFLSTYGVLNGTNFRAKGASIAIDEAKQNEKIDSWANENCPSDNT